MIRPFQNDEYVMGATGASFQDTNQLEFAFGYFQEHSDSKERHRLAYIKNDRGPASPGEYAVVYKKSVRRVKPPFGFTF